MKLRNLIRFFASCTFPIFAVLVDTGCSQNGFEKLPEAKTLANYPLWIMEPPRMTAAKAGLTVSGVCLTGVPVELSGDISNNMITDCQDAKWSIYVPFSAGEGIKNVVATQNDPKNPEEPLTDNRDFVRDNTAPVILITGPAINTYSTGSLLVQGTCETGLNVVLGGTGAASSVTGSCSNGTFSIRVTLSTPDGVKNISASQTDEAGNVGSDSRNFIRDATMPIVRITAPAANSAFQTAVNISGSCETGLPVTINGSGASGTQTVTCASGAFTANVNFTAPDGVKNIVASQTDTAGNTGTDNRNFVRDTAGPVIRITAPAANSAWQNGLTLTGSCETGLTVAISGTGVNGNSTAPCTNGSFTAAVLFSSGDGVKNILVGQMDAAGNIGTDNRNFIRDTTAPVVAITAPAANSPVAATAAITGTCETGITVNLTGTGISAPVNANCTSGIFSASVTFTAGDGVKNVVASQRDAAGNVGSTNRNFLRDSTAPAVAINAPAANTTAQTGLTVSGTCETGIIVNISGTGVAAPTTTACNAGTFSTPITFSANDGTKNVIASQTDTSGNTGTSNRNFIKDTTAPMVRITAPAANTVALNGVTVVGTCETGLTVNISGTGVNTPSTTGCAAGTFSVAITYSAGDGVKNVIASQTDAAGNTGSDNRNFLRNSVGPVITITLPAPNTAAQTGVTLQGTCNASYPIAVSGTGISAPFTATCASNGTFSFPITFSANDGVKNVIVSQTDNGGLTGTDNRNFIRDTTDPVVAITAPAANSSAQTGLTISGSCETGIIVNISGTGVNAPSTTACTAGAFSTAIVFSAGDGVKNVIATQTDAAGNTGTDNRNFIRDTLAPAVAITAPAANSLVGATATISGTCETGLNVTVAGAGVQTPVNTNCTAGTFSTSVTFTLADGTKNVTASQTDAAGNVGSDNRNLVKDTNGPVIAITNPAAGTTAQNGLTISGICESGLTVNVSGAGVASASTAACTSGVFTTAILFSAGDGSKNVVVSQTDNGGLTGTDNRNFNRDTTAPLVAITAPPEGTVARNGLTVSGTCETGRTVTISGTGVAATSTTSCTGGTFSTAITFSANDGVKNVIASQTDAAGNTGTDNRNFLRDTLAPAIQITAPAANSLVMATATITGTCETGLTVTLGGTGLQAAVNTACAAGAFSALVTFTAADGVKNVTATQTDAAGNVGSDNRNFNKDTLAPSIAITAPAANTVAQTGLTVSGTCENGIIVNISGTGVSAPSTTTCASGVFSTAIVFSAGDGVKNVVASQTDNAGLTGSDNRNFLRDSTAPMVAITAPAADTQANASIGISGTCETGIPVNISGTGVSAPSTTACAAGAFSTTVNFSSGYGPKNVVASQTDAAGNTGSDNRNFINIGSGITETFTITNGNTGTKKVDILFVDDNSVSMEYEQARLGPRFTTFISELSGVDWQIGVTTSDVDAASSFGMMGALLDLAGRPAGEYILDASTPNADTVFKNTIERPETINCVAQGVCPSGLEQPLAATNLAADKRNTDNTGFFRSDANLAVVILSDEDEMSNGRPAATKPQQVIDHLHAIWPTKNVSAYAIVILPGDTACLANQQAQPYATASYGTHAVQLAQLTGGVSGSICDSDYSSTLSDIGRNVVRLIQSVSLTRVPIVSTVSVTMTPNQGITWTVQGNKVVFSAPPADGTVVQVTYEY